MESRPEPSHTTPTAAPTGRSWPRRYNLVGLCFLSTFICYIDRVNISVAIIPMAEEFGWDQTTRGIVLSSFFYGYLATQVFGGWLADRFGGKIVLGIGVVWWSVFTLITPPAAALSFTILFLARVGMGLGEGSPFRPSTTCTRAGSPRRNAPGRRPSTPAAFPWGRSAPCC